MHAKGVMQVVRFWERSGAATPPQLVSERPVGCPVNLALEEVAF